MMRTAEPSLALIILAAGKSSRFGAIKQLALYEGRPLILHLVDACAALHQYPTYVVLGANQELISQAIHPGKAKIMINQNWQEGIASSIRKAVDELGSRFDALLLVAADQVQIGASQLERLVVEWCKQPDCISCAVYEGGLGIPAIFPRLFYHELLLLKGDTGGKKILGALAEQLQRVEMPEAAIDIDFPEDLQNIVVPPLN